MKKSTVVTIILIGIMALIGIYLLVWSRVGKVYAPNYTLEDFYVMPKKNLGVNEYQVSTIDEESVVIMYFNTYAALLFEDINRAYSLLDEESQLEVFPNVNSFKTKVASLTKDFTELPKIDTYNVKTEDDKKVYTINDKNGNIYVFSVEAVMKYTVTLK